MPRYEYKLVPAPERATKHKGLKGAASFAATLEDVMNAMGAEGWHYLRADTLPQEERSGLTSKTTTYRNLLVFQRELPSTAPRMSPPPRQEENDAEEEEEAPFVNLFADPDDTPDPPPPPPARKA